MKRKFSPNKLYKLIKYLVIGVSSICLLLGIYISINWEDTQQRLLQRHTECFDNFESTGVPGFDQEYRDFCNISLDILVETEEWMTRYYAIGIGLPIVFFGGTYLYRYLFPVSKK